MHISYSDHAPISDNPSPDRPDLERSEAETFYRRPIGRLGVARRRSSRTLKQYFSCVQEADMEPDG